LSDLTFKFDDEYEGYASYYINIVISKGFANTINDYKQPLTELIKIINNLVAFDNAFLTSEETKNIHEIIINLKKIEKTIFERYSKTEYINSVKNIISSEASTYNSDVKKASSSNDVKMASYKRKKQNFIDSVVDAVKSKFKSHCCLLPKTIEKGSGTTDFINQGFRFISTAKYNSIDNIKEELLSSVFNNDFKDETALLGIKDYETFKSAISNCGRTGKYEDKYNENIEKFISASINENHSIIEISTLNETGGTLGEQALAYYKYITNVEASDKIILIDQPEDNISVPGIMKKLIDYLNKLRDKKQIIFVTHNPLLVINLDVDNVIYLKRINNKIDCISGCLESGNIIEYVEENLDGGKEALKKRLKVYE
jgi:predicted ATP-dependent endonuclease of OLD family